MDQPAALPRLDRASLLRFLTSDAVVAEDGRVWSWHNPAHPGYAYPEAAGLWLSLMSREPEADEAALDRVAAWLRRCEAEVGIGRDGRRYLFDHGMVIAGWLAFGERRGFDREALRGSIASLCTALRERRAVDPLGAGQRWSERFGPHLLKLALPLLELVERAELPVDAIVDDLAPLLDGTDGGPIPHGTASTPSYVHACCYAAEGRWRLAVSPVLAPALRSRALAAAHDTAHWLAEIQRADGGLPPWHDGTRGHGPAPADAAAQAIRLWSGLDRTRFGPAIERALSFLARLATPCGGLRYHEHSDDLNTWATLFAVQALDFARGRADVTTLV